MLVGVIDVHLAAEDDDRVVLVLGPRRRAPQGEARLLDDVAVRGRAFAHDAGGCVVLVDQRQHPHGWKLYRLRCRSVVARSRAFGFPPSRAYATVTLTRSPRRRRTSERIAFA